MGYASTNSWFASHMHLASVEHQLSAIEDAVADAHRSLLDSDKTRQLQHAVLAATIAGLRNHIDSELAHVRVEQTYNLTELIRIVDQARASAWHDFWSGCWRAVRARWRSLIRYVIREG